MIDFNALIISNQDGLFYEKFTETPFSGEVKGRRKGKLIEGKEEGIWIEFYDSGQLKSKTNFKNGKKEGESLEYDEEGGFVKRKVHYKDGAEEGECITYHAKDFIFSKGNIKDWELVGEYKLYYKYKNTVFAIGNIEKGLWRGKYQEYFINGVLKKEGNRYAGRPPQRIDDYLFDEEYKNYFDNFYKEIIIDPESFRKEAYHWNGEYKEYHDNGQLSFETNMENGIPEGKWLEYHENGQLLKEGFREYDHWEGKYVEYYENGKICKEGYMKGSHWDGEYKYFDEEGFLKSKGIEHLNEEGKYEYTVEHYRINGKVELLIEGKNDNLVNTASHKYYDKHGNLEKEQIENHYSKDHHKGAKFEIFENGKLIHSHKNNRKIDLY